MDIYGYGVNRFSVKKTKMHIVSYRMAGYKHLVMMASVWRCDENAHAVSEMPQLTSISAETQREKEFIRTSFSPPGLYGSPLGSGESSVLTFLPKFN